MDNHHRYSEMPRYLRDYYGAPNRLKECRAAGAGDWRKGRAWGYHNWHSAFAALSQGAPGQWYCHTGEQFRGECFAETHHRGWFTDTECSEVARGIVARLSHGRFIAGYYWSSNGERVYFAGVYGGFPRNLHAVTETD